MTAQDAIDQIASIIHCYDHPSYDTVAYCVFCHAIAVQVVEALDREEGP
jgi:hypothetical protein